MHQMAEDLRTVVRNASMIGKEVRLHIIDEAGCSPLHRASLLVGDMLDDAGGLVDDLRHSAGPPFKHPCHGTPDGDNYDVENEAEEAGGVCVIILTFLWR